MVGSSESTVARRARNMLDRGLIRVAGQAEPTRMGFGYPGVVHVACTPGAAVSVARAIAARPDVRFLTLATGSSNIVFELIVPSPRHLQRLLVREILRLPGVASTTIDHVMHVFKTSYDWSRALLDRQGVDPSFGEGLRRPTKTADLALDAVDMQLIQLLGEDGRRSYSELAGALGISESMTRMRFSALLDHGYLTLATFVDPELLGYEIEVLVWLQVDLGRLEPIANALAARPEVRYLSATTGGNDLMCEVILRSPDDLYGFATETLGALEGVRRVGVDHELMVLKRAYVQATNGLPEEDEEAPDAGALTEAL